MTAAKTMATLSSIPPDTILYLQCTVVTAEGEVFNFNIKSEKLMARFSEKEQAALTEKVFKSLGLEIIC